MMKQLLFVCLTVCAVRAQTNFHKSSKDFSKVGVDIPTIKIDPAAVDTFIKDILTCKDSLSAVAIAIVQLDKDDALVDQYHNGYGSLDPTDPEQGEVDEFNNFCIGSISKQFTAALAGLALEKHGMDFDAKLVNVLGEAGRFFNEKGLDQLPTVRDLLSHRMAIPRYDFAWLAGLNGTRLDYWPKLHNLEDSKVDYTSQKFRSSFEYNNWMVSLAGYVTELLTNQTWEAEVIEKYYFPLELHNATFAHLQWYNRSKAALPAYRVNDTTDPRGFKWLPLSVDFMRETVEKVAPAGSICLSSADMEKYLTFLLNSTHKNEEERMLKKKITQTMLETSNFMTSVPDRVPNDVLFSSDNYALAWGHGYYRNYEHIWHDGSISGYYSIELIYPRLNLGIFVSTTNGFLDTDKSLSIAKGLFDMVMGVPAAEKPLSSADICAEEDSPPEPNPDSLKPSPTCLETKDAVDLEPLAGTYHHEVFGDIVIRYDKDAADIKRFTFEYGKFARGSLCPQLEENKEFKRFQLYFDPESPLWFYNDPTTSELNGLEFIFARDKANRGTSFVFPGLQSSAPTEKQTYYKKDYHPCDNPNPCKNGGTCFLYGELDFTCACPPPTSGNLCEKTPLTDCSDWKKYHPELSNSSGVYPISIPGIDETYNVYCDMEDDNGGWTIIHRRLQETSPTSFNVKFPQYVDGFGLPGSSHSYWIGLNALSSLANANNSYTLRIGLEDCNDRSVTETYEEFWIGDASTQYTLHLKSGAATGTAGDALTISNSYLNHNNMKFSTPDKDDTNKCASTYNSGWWFNNCFAANLNGQYYNDCKTTKTDGITWIPFHNNKYSMKSAYMKIRRT